MEQTKNKSALKEVLAAIFAVAFTLALVFAILPATTLTAHAAASEYTIVWDKATLESFEEYPNEGYTKAFKDPTTQKTITYTHGSATLFHEKDTQDVYNEDWGDWESVDVFCGLYINNSTVNTLGFTFSVDTSETSETVFTKIEMIGTSSYIYKAVSPGLSSNDSSLTWTGESATFEFFDEAYVDYVTEIRFTIKITTHTYSTLAFNPMGGTINVEVPSRYEEGIALTLPSDVTREGYDFGGWYNHPELTGESIDAISTTDTGNKTFFAKWETANSATIQTNSQLYRYGDDSVSIAVTDKGNKNYGACLKTNQTMTIATNGGLIRDLLLLIGNGNANNVKVDNNLGVKQVFSYGGATYVALRDVNAVRAVFRTTSGLTYIKRVVVNYDAPVFHNVTLHTNEGTINAGELSTYAENLGATLPTDVTREGYVFKGWYDNAGLEGAQVTAIGADATTDKEFWAKWNPTVTYNLDGGAINGDYATQYAEGEGLTLPADVTKEGFVFGGWYDGATGPVATVTTDDRGPKTYTAKWLAYYVVGDMTDWTIDPDYRLIRNESASTEEYSLVATLSAKDGIKVVYGAQEDLRVWYPDGMDNSYHVVKDEEYRLYFRPLGDGGEGWHYNVIYTKLRGADDTDILISAIGDVVYTQECKAKIDAARARYDSLSYSQRDGVTLYSTLTNAEETYALSKQVGDIIAAYELELMVTALPKADELIRIDTNDVLAVKAAYDAMCPEAQANVSEETLNTLTAALEKVASFDTEYAALLSNCQHYLFEMNVTVDDGLGIDKNYRSDYVSNPMGVRVNFPRHGSTGQLVGGTATVTMTFYVPQAKTVNFYWGFQHQDGYTNSSVSINLNNKSIGSYSNMDTRSADNGGNWTADDWKTCQASCRAGYNTIVFSCWASTAKGWGEIWAGRNFYVLFESFGPEGSMIEGDHCKACGAVCTHEQLTLVDVNGTYVYQCQGMCKKTIDLSELAFDNKAAVASARAAYDALSNDDKNKVPQDTLNKLIAAEQAITEFEGAEAVQATINALPSLTEITLENKDAILAAKAAFDDLNDKQKGMIPAAAARLAASLQQIDDIEAANLMSELIQNLPDAKDVTLAHKEQVMQAVAKYDELTPIQKARVLPSAFVKLRADEKKINDIEAANDFLDKMNAIGTVEYTDECRQAIELARNTYTVISPEAKAIAGDITVLTNAEASFASLATTAINDLIGDLQVAELTLNDKDAILAAKAAYDALTSEEKAYIPDEVSDKIETLVTEINDLEAASAVADSIDALPSLSDVTPNDKDAVMQARAAYEALSDKQKAKVSPETLEKLQAAEQEIETIETITQTINNLPALAEITLDDKDQINAAQTAYEALSDKQKAKIPEETKNKLLSAKQEIANAEAAAQANKAINELPAVDAITIDDKDQVQAAREAYDALEDKERVPAASVEKLEAAEKKIADIEAANAFVAKMNAIGSVAYDEASKTAIEQARSAYNELSPEAKALAGDITVLTDAESSYAGFATQSINGVVDALDEVSLDDKDDILAAKEAYDALSPEEQANVPKDTVDKLNAAVKEIADIEAANEADEEINDLLDIPEITLDSKDDIKAAKEAYDALSDEQKQKFPKETLDKLNAAIKEIADIEKANEADEEINDLLDIPEITLDDKDDIKAAKEAYDALTDEQKQKFPKETLDKLNAALKEIADIEKANEADGEINDLLNIPEITLDSKDDIKAAKEAYDALTDEQKQKFPKETVDKLQAAVKEIEDLETAAEITETIVELPLVETLTIDNKDDVVAARNAYEAMTDEQKANVAQETLAKLQEAEQEIEDIETAAETTETIAELPSVDELTIENKSDVVAARSVFLAMTSYQQSKVSQETLAKLQAAESVIADIESIAVSEGENKTFTKEIDPSDAENGVSVKQLFKIAAGDGNDAKEAVVKADDTTVVFDAAAVNAIGDKATTFSIKLTEVNMDNAILRIDLTLSGTTFAEGSATVSTKFEKEVPAGKVAKVYYVADDGARTDMNAKFELGKVSFVTSHFSTYLVVYEDIPATGLSSGAIAGIVIGSVFGALLIACAVLFLLNKKGIVKLGKKN